MKKKIMTISLVVALAAIAIVGGTLAYFTDTDDAVMNLLLVMLRSICTRPTRKILPLLTKSTTLG